MLELVDESAEVPARKVVLDLVVAIDGGVGVGHRQVEHLAFIAAGAGGDRKQVAVGKESADNSSRRRRNRVDARREENGDAPVGVDVGRVAEVLDVEWVTNVVEALAERRHLYAGVAARR